MNTDPGRHKKKTGHRARHETQHLREIEKAGFRWAVRCFDVHLSREDLAFFALRYEPFYEAMQEAQAGRASIVGFDPFSQHEKCEVLFREAFSRHGARMITPPEYPAGRVPDLRFAAFEKGVIESLRNLYQLEQNGKLSKD